MMRSAALLSVCLLTSCGIAGAQIAGVPAEEPVNPDRPDVTNGTHIVDVGLLQIEVGGLYVRAAGGRAWGSPVTARIGLLDWLEGRVGTDGLLTQIDGDARVTGLGNVQLGAKLRLWADPGGIPVLSILPTVTLPTASAEKGLGSGDADFTIVLLTGRDFGARTHLDVNYGAGSIGAGGPRPHFAQQIVSLSASMAATARWNPYLEGFWFSRQTPDTGAMSAMDLGAIVTLNARLALDGGIQFGLSRDAPDVAAFGGISLVVGNVLGDHGVHARQRKALARAAGRRK